MISIDLQANKNNIKISIDNDQVFDALRVAFSEPNQNAHFVKRRGGFSSELNYAITPTGVTKLGLLWSIRRWFATNNVVDEIHYSDFFRESTTNKYQECTVVDDCTHKLRHYQRTAVEKSLYMGRGLVVVGTGGGKTLTTAALLESIYRHNKSTKILVITPGTTLAKQTLNELDAEGVTFSLGGWDSRKNQTCTVVNSELFVKRFSGTEKEIVDVDVLIVDEVHKVKHNNKITSLIQKIPTYHKFGLTGTLPPSKKDEWAVVGLFGPVIFEKSSASLRDEKYLTNVKAHVLKINHSNNYIPSQQTGREASHNEELEFLQNNKFRNDILLKICKNHSKNILILIDRIAHGEILHELIQKNTNKSVFFIQGSTDQETRQEILKTIEKRNDIICIAISRILSTGIDTKNLHSIVFCSGGKSFIRVVQSIGRGLRLHPRKTQLNIFDFADNTKYSTRHSVERLKIYEDQAIPVKELEINEI